MPKAMLIDFDAEVGFTFDEMPRIGVLIEDGQGGLVIRYRREIEEQEALTGHQDYKQTVEAITPAIDAWNNEAEKIDWRALLTRLANQSYLGLRFRVVTLVDDEMTLDEAFARYVEGDELIPVVENEAVELSDV